MNHKIIHNSFSNKYFNKKLVTVTTIIITTTSGFPFRIPHKLPY